MRLIRAIVGSREFHRTSAVDLYVRKHCDPTKVALVSGGATGVDGRAERTAVELGFRRARYRGSIPEHGPALGWFWCIRPDYERHGFTGAPKLRNALIADVCTEMVAFWDGSKQSGTINAVRHAAHMGKPGTVYEWNGVRWRVHDLRDFAYQGYRAGWPGRRAA